MLQWSDLSKRHPPPFAEGSSSQRDKTLRERRVWNWSCPHMDGSIASRRTDTTSSVHTGHCVHPAETLKSHVGGDNGGSGAPSLITEPCHTQAQSRTYWALESIILHSYRNCFQLLLITTDPRWHGATMGLKSWTRGAWLELWRGPEPGSIAGLCRMVVEVQGDQAASNSISDASLSCTNLLKRNLF